MLEIGILTGYQVTNLDSLKDQAPGVVDRIESSKEKVDIYLNQLTKTEVCLTITMRPEQMINNVQRALIKLYRYYDKDSISMKFYKPINSGSTDYCVICPECCLEQKGKKVKDKKDKKNPKP
jgi:hypothetical protein